MPKTHSKIVIACGILLALSACDTSHVYEFPSCNYKNDRLINVMNVPRGYQSSNPKDQIISDKEPVGWQEKDPNGPGYFVRNGGFISTVLYTTYPEFEPLGGTNWRTLDKEEDARIKVDFGYIYFAYGQVSRPDTDEFIHDPNFKRKHIFQRIREDSVDGNFWTYPPYDQRTTKATGRPTYFMPKDTGINVTIGCKDIGVNSFPGKDERCFIDSQFTDSPALNCMHVGYRIQAKDIPNWREFDARAKQRIKSMITQRPHTYTGPAKKVEK